MGRGVTGIPCGRLVECQAKRQEGAVVTKTIAHVRTRGCMRPWRWRPGREGQGTVHAAEKCLATGKYQR
jgi:hypothetical protein